MATTALTERLAASTYVMKARWATVRVETEGAVYVGRMYIPEGKKRLSDALCDERPFLNLTDVMINESEHIEPFVALNKGYVRTVRILQDGQVQPPAPFPAR
jgi:hypothetical protein